MRTRTGAEATQTSPARGRDGCRVSSRCLRPRRPVSALGACGPGVLLRVLLLELRDALRVRAVAGLVDHRGAFEGADDLVALVVALRADGHHAHRGAGLRFADAEDLGP